MKIQAVSMLPKARDDAAKLRRDRVRKILLDAYDSGTELIEIENEGEFPSMHRMREIFCQEGRRAAYQIERQDNRAKVGSTAFKCNVKCGRLYVRIMRSERGAPNGN